MQGNVTNDHLNIGSNDENEVEVLDYGYKGGRNIKNVKLLQVKDIIERLEIIKLSRQLKEMNQ